MRNACAGTLRKWLRSRRTSSWPMAPVWWDHCCRRRAAPALASLLIEVLGWRDAYLSISSFAALLDTGRHAARERRAGLNGGRTQRVEARFLFVTELQVEALKRRPHGLHRLQHNLQPALHCGEAPHRRARQVVRAT